MTFVDFDTTDPNVVYIDAWVSKDDGINWERLDVHEYFAQSTINPDVMLTFSNLGLKRSLNGGLDWEEAVHGVENIKITDVDLDRFDPQVIYIASAQGIGRSLDGGTTWQLPVNDMGDRTAVKASLSETGVVYEGDFIGNISKSIDYGATWIVSNVESSIEENDRKPAIMDIAIDPSNAVHVYGC